MPLVPELYIANIEQSLQFYCGILGFSIEYQRLEQDFALIALEDCRLMLEQYHATTTSTATEWAQGRWRTATLEYPLSRGINFEFSLSDIMYHSCLAKIQNCVISVFLFNLLPSLYLGFVKNIFATGIIIVSKSILS